MVYRVFVEKKEELAGEARALLADLKSLLGIGSLTGLRLLNRYDAENISAENFEYAVRTVFSEPQLDICYREFPTPEGSRLFAVEFLPGQFDQRADSAAQCIQILTGGERPVVRSARVYVLEGAVSDAELAEIKAYVINPVEAREASLEKPESLSAQYEIPETVETLNGFNALSRAELADFIARYGLAMDLDDIAFCQSYFLKEGRDPSITEIRMIDTYWSDHCRHTTFLTHIDGVKFADPELEAAWGDYLKTRQELGRTKPICLMDIGTLAAKALKKQGKLRNLDESEEINACTVKIEVEADGVKEPWLLLFKNETHNHPTEIEPFGGAATCLGGAIRDPLSGRAYVYAAMRLTGAADPTVPVSETIPGKLPQRKLVTTAAQGYSSYGNQIGLTTGMVDELYHPGYAAKRMEVGAVVAAAPQANVRREEPLPGDVVILLGGATGRDGIGGATGASKAHNAHSVETCGAEVQKGNAPEERKIQRLFRNAEVARMIKRCNDFGAGGVSVAIGELAAGLDIDLNAVPKKYEGLDGTELAISESQERMACVVAAEDAERFKALADAENLDAVAVARVKAEPRLTMVWNGRSIVDISREFLDSNGADKHISIETQAPEAYEKSISGSFGENYKALAADLNCCSKRGLSERFDSTVGGGTVLMPFGGKYQRTPIQAMVHKISMEKKHTDDASFMSWGYNPYVSEKSPFHGAYLAVLESAAKLVAAGAKFEDVYLSFQEYFQKPGNDGARWGQPLEALLGAFKAQMELGIGAIGGKDSMSGSFEQMNVPPTLISFAITADKAGHAVSPEFKGAGHPVVLLAPKYGANGLPEAESELALFDAVTALLREGRALTAYTPGLGGIAEAVLKMALGNGIGFAFEKGLTLQELFGYKYGAFLLEMSGEELPEGALLLGRTTEEEVICREGECLSLEELSALYEDKLEKVFPCNLPAAPVPVENFSYEAKSWPAPHVKCAKPQVLIPAFPGTNCEYDTAKSMEDAGAKARIFVVRNRTAADIQSSVEEFAALTKESQMIILPGGFSGGDEPDGSGKFITAFFRNAAVKEGVTELLEQRDGLMCGICNGFQALIKLGLVPYGRIMDTDESCPTLSFNIIGRHQSKIIQTRVASNKSPWLALTHVGEVYNAAISHGEGRFLCDEALARKLAENGQIATQYVDLSGNATAEIQYNPNGSIFAVEGITSPDGRVFGKMGHCERYGANLFRNVPGDYDMKMFRAAVEYFR